MAGDRPGHQIEYPLAIVIICGLCTSTVMNLLLMPALYRLFGRAQRLPATPNVAT